MATAAEIKAKALARLQELKNGQRANGLAGQLPADDGERNSRQSSTTNQPQPIVGNQVNESNGRSEDSTVGSRELVVELQPAALVVVERPMEIQNQDSGDRRISGSELESKTNLDCTNPVHASFLQRLGELEASLLTRDPLMKTHLKVIHETMIAEEEIVNLLTVEEISKIMASQQVFTNTVLARDVAKSSKARNSSKAAQISLDDV